jgi:hypothetical protein
MKSNTDQVFYYSGWRFDTDQRDHAVLTTNFDDPAEGFSIYERLPDGTDRCLIDLENNGEQQAKYLTDKLNEASVVKIPNGYPSWAETHYEVVQHLTATADHSGSMANHAREAGGTGFLYTLAEKLTNEFEAEMKGMEWDGEFFEAIDAFLKEKEKQHRKDQQTTN